MRWVCFVVGLVVIWAVVAFAAPCNCTRVPQADTITPGFKIQCSQTTCGSTPPPTAPTPPTTSTTLPSGVASFQRVQTPDAKNPSGVMGSDGTFRQGGYGGWDLGRSTAYQAGARVHANHNGDVYEAQGAGVTSATQPVIPKVRYRFQALAAGQPVYIGYAGSRVPGWFYVALTSCVTSRKQDGAIAWPTVAGATVGDGSCTFRAAQRSSLTTFVDGTVTFKQGAGVDAYDGEETFRGGQEDANAGAADLVPGDNSSRSFSIAKANVTNGPWYRAGDKVGTGEWQRMGGADWRDGKPQNNIEGGTAPSVLKIGGGARLMPPDMPPLVELGVDGSGGFGPGNRYTWTFAWADKVLGIPTKASLRNADVVVPGNRSMTISVPEDADFQWPAPVGGNNNSQTGVFLYVGDYDDVWKWCMYAGVLRHGEKITFTTDAQLQENQTCAAFNEATQPWFWIGNPTFAYAGVWQAGVTVGPTERVAVKPTIDNGYTYILDRICTSGYTDCNWGSGTQCTTGASEPDWATWQNKDLIIDGTCRWWRLPFQLPTMGIAGDLIFINMHPDGSVVRWGEEGVTPVGRIRARDVSNAPGFVIQQLDGTAGNPLATVLKSWP